MSKDLEERQTTLAEKLKARSATLTKKELEEVCIILVDVSGSMNESAGNNLSRLESVKRAIPYLHARGSYVGYGLVAFGTEAYPIQPQTTNFNQIIIKSQSLLTEDYTNISGAIFVGLKMMVDSKVEKRRLILMTDGHQNVDSRFLDSAVDHCVKDRVIVDCIAFGRDADEDLLRSISTRTGGIFQRADSPQALAQAYAKLNYQVRYLEHKGG